MPGSVEEIAALFARCGAEGYGVALVGPRFARRSARRRPVLVDLRRLDAVEHIDEVSRVVRAQAGITLAGLERELRARGLTLGPVAARHPALPVGELLQCPDAADRSPRYGRPTDACLGLHAMRADGTVLHWRDAPRKAAGPDWRALVLGARGEGAVLTAVTLRVYGLPEVVREAAYRFASRAAALRACREAVRREVRPATWWCTTTLAARLEGPRTIVAAEEQALRDAARAEGGRPAEPTARPIRPAAHLRWSELLRRGGAVSEMTLDGGCLHGRAAPEAELPGRITHAVDPKGVLC